MEKNNSKFKYLPGLRSKIYEITSIKSFTHEVLSNKIQSAPNFPFKKLF